MKTAASFVVQYDDVLYCAADRRGTISAEEKRDCRRSVAKTDQFKIGSH
jgi:hypothetical protein